MALEAAAEAVAASGDLAVGVAGLEAADRRRVGDMKKNRVHISESEQTRIQKAVEQAELRTLGEIVPVIRRASDAYLWVPFFWGVTFFLVSLVVWALLFFQSPWEISIPLMFVTQTGALALGMTIGTSPTVKHWTVPRHRQALSAERQCFADFVRLGLTETELRSGVLIFLSLLERRVIILGDKGIHTKVPAGYWDELVKKLVSGIQGGKVTESLCDVIGEVGERLAGYFPPHPGQKNELSDRPVTD